MNTMSDPTLENLVIKKLALEAFEMVFAGESTDAAKVFAAIAAIKPGSRASALGVALTEFFQVNHAGDLNASGGPDHEDPFMGCIKGLAWLQQGRVSEARAILQQVSLSEDIPAAQLAKSILSHETGGA